jgi:DNA-binding response OmpR family regulator
MNDYQARVLVVDDEPKMVDMIVDYLSATGFVTASAKNGKEALEVIEKTPPDIVVLDVMMPGIDGFDTARRIRKSCGVPIILLTAKAQEGDKLMGLEIGADDYITKPFSLKELAARIRAVLRRSGAAGEGESSGGGETLSLGDLLIDRQRRLVFRGDKRIELTGLQFDLLFHMALGEGRVFERLQLLELLEDRANENYERTIDVHIKNIRKALEPNPSKPRYIHTVWGVGYKAEYYPEDDGE